MTLKVDGLTQLIRSSTAHHPADVHKLRWWMFGMGAVAVAALAVAGAAIALMLTSR